MNMKPPFSLYLVNSPDSACFSAQKDSLESGFVLFLFPFFFFPLLLLLSACENIARLKELRTYVSRGEGDNNLTCFLKAESFYFQQNTRLQFKQFSRLSSFLLWYHGQSLKVVHFNAYSKRKSVE